MKILQIVQKPQRRGAEVFAFQLSHELCRQGHEVRTAYLYPYQGINPLPLQKSDRVLAGRENHPFEKYPGCHPQLLSRILQIMGEFRPDVVQVNGARTVKYGAFARYFRRGEPWVLIYRNIGHPREWVRGWQRNIFYRKLVIPNLNGIIGVSQVTLQSVRDFYTLTIPMTHIANGVDPDFASQASQQEIRHRTKTPLEAPVLLFVGSLTPEKRLDRLLRLMRNIIRHIPSVHLWVVGDGPLRREAEQNAKDMALGEHVHFLGVKADVADYMNAANIFVLTSDTEGIPAVILEAGLSKLPVVATEVGGLPESVLNGETGYLVDPRDEQRMSQILCNLLQDTDRQNKMGTRAEMWVRENFTMDIIARKYANFYYKVFAA